jgi:hypothetical protein
MSSLEKIILVQLGNLPFVALLICQHKNFYILSIIALQYFMKNIFCQLIQTHSIHMNKKNRTLRYTKASMSRFQDWGKWRS